MNFYSLDNRDRFLLFSNNYHDLSDSLFRKFWIACNDSNYIIRASAIYDFLLMCDSDTYNTVKDSISTFIMARDAEDAESKESEAEAQPDVEKSKTDKIASAGEAESEEKQKPKKSKAKTPSTTA
jgi:hypothetical protein